VPQIGKGIEKDDDHIRQKTFDPPDALFHFSPSVLLLSAVFCV
jgi:hypothetical protein